MGAEGVREEGVSVMVISIPEFIQRSGVMKNMEGMEPLDFYELFPEELTEYIVLGQSNYYEQELCLMSSNFVPTCHIYWT